MSCYSCRLDLWTTNINSRKRKTLSWGHGIPPRLPPICLPSLTLTHRFVIMSHTHPASPSVTNFQLIFSTALKAYEKKTGKDILSHPLAAELQACQSPSNIVAILQQRAQDFDQSRKGGERLTRWLVPTVNVLHAFSETIGEGTGLVRLITWTLTSGL